MNSDWPETELGSIVENHDRFRIPITRKDRIPGPYPYYGAAGIQDWVDDFIFDGLHVLVAEDGTVETESGHLVTQIVDGKFWVNNHAHVLKGKTEFDTRYIYYALKTVKARPYMTGAVQKKINQGNLNRIKIPYPSEEERHRIASVLGIIDKKINLNRSMNTAIMEICSTLFESYFIEFEADESIDLVDSEIGKIPRGWGIGTISDLGELVTTTVKPYQSPDLGWDHYSIPAFDTDALPTVDLGSTILSNKYAVPSDSVLVSKLNPRFPRIWMPNVQDITTAICSTEFMPFVPKLGTRSFLYDFFSSSIAQRALKARATGTTGSRQRVRPSEVVTLKALLPPSDTIQAYDKIVAPLHQRRLQNITQCRTLESIRNTLIPKLISGKTKLPVSLNILEA